MAKLERSVNASDKGGWIEMTEEPERVIEEYLALVNEHLPESISEDVITELRTYMFETALDLGNGELTAQSAKKVVAQFGAPSEVAEEYKYSMLPETLPPLEKETSHERLTEKQMMEPELETKEQKPHKDPTVSYTNFFLQGISIVVFWSLLIGLASTFLGPIWLFPRTLIVLLCQILLVVISIAILSYYLKRKRTILWKRSYPEWPFVQRFLTFPENAIKELPDVVISIDVLGSLIGVALVLLSSLFAPSSLYIPLIGIPTSVALLVKAFYSGKRMNAENPMEYIKGELASTFAALLLIDSSQIWITSSFWEISYLFRTAFWNYSIIWGAVLLFQLIVRGGDFWWDIDDSKPKLTTYKTGKLLESNKNIAGSTILRIIGWTILFTVIPTYCLMISPNIYTPWFAAGLIALYFGPVFLSPVVLYFLFRRWIIKKGISKHIIGNRSRLEAVGDLGIAVFLFFEIIFSGIIWLDQYYLVEQYHLVYFDFGTTGVLYFMIGYFSSYLLLIFALVLRIIGDCLEFSRNRIYASESIMISGRVLIIALSIKVGIDILSYNNILFPLNLYPTILFLAVLIAFQVETTQFKVREMKLRSSIDSIKPNDNENPRENSPNNTQRIKPSNQFPGS